MIQLLYEILSNEFNRVLKEVAQKISAWNILFKLRRDGGYHCHLCQRDKAWVVNEIPYKCHDFIVYSQHHLWYIKTIVVAIKNTIYR